MQKILTGTRRLWPWYAKLFLVVGIVLSLGMVSAAINTLDATSGALRLSAALEKLGLASRDCRMLDRVGEHAGDSLWSSPDGLALVSRPGISGTF